MVEEKFIGEKRRKKVARVGDRAAWGEWGGEGRGEPGAEARRPKRQPGRTR